MSNSSPAFLGQSSDHPIAQNTVHPQTDRGGHFWPQGRILIATVQAGIGQLTGSAPLISACFFGDRTHRHYLPEGLVQTMKSTALRHVMRFSVLASTVLLFVGCVFFMMVYFLWPKTISSAMA